MVLKIFRRLIAGSGTNIIVYQSAVLGDSVAAGLTEFNAIYGSVGFNAGKNFRECNTGESGTMIKMACDVRLNGSNRDAVVTLAINAGFGNLTFTIPNGTTGYFEDDVNTDIIDEADLLSERVVIAPGSGTVTWNCMTVSLET